MKRNYLPLVGLALMVCLFVSPFVFNYLRYLAGHSQDPTDGRFAGVMQVTYTGRDETGKDVTRDLGKVVVAYEQRPLAFSYLSRVTSSARIADSKGNERIVGIVRYDTWEIAWQGPSDELMGLGVPGEILQARWNKKVDPFQLEFKQTLEYPRSGSLGDGILRLTGVLQPASGDTYAQLRKTLASR